MDKEKRSSIFVRTYLTMFLAGMLIFLIIFLIILLALPTIYQKYQKDEAEKSLALVIQNANETGHIISEQNVEILESVKGFLVLENVNSNEKQVYGVSFDRNTVLKTFEESMINPLLDYQTREQQFRPLPTVLFNVSLVVPLGKGDDVAQVLIGIIKYLFIVVIICSSVVSYFFAESFAKPLLVLQKKTNDIARLKLDTNLRLNRTDELGDLDHNLDVVRQSMRKVLNDLSHDVERATSMEKNRRIHMATMSHELKTPLMVLKGQTECMIDNVGVYADRDFYLKENLDILQMMEDLVRDILFSAKIDDDGYSITKKEVHVNDIIFSQIKLLRAIYSTDDYKINVSDRGEFVMMGDQSLMEQLVKNIIENALKYSDDQKVNIKITDTEFEITNKNIDFPIDTPSINELFQPFKRLDSSRNSQTGGHGLGLYMVKRIAFLNGLDLSLTKKGQQVLFKINLHEEKNDK